MRFIIGYFRIAFLWLRSFFVRELPPVVTPTAIAEMHVENLIREIVAIAKEEPPTFVVLNVGTDGTYNNREKSDRIIAI